jgi:small conductance mechanosensitive channel
MTDLLETVQTLGLTLGLNLVWAIVIFAIGWWAAGLISNLFKKTLTKTQTNQMLVRFISNLIYYAVLTFAALAAFDRLGVETTSFIAVLGAAGLAIGLALQGALGNFAAGVLILIFRPFKIGDLVEVSDVYGRVEDIQIFNTIVVTLDNKTAIIPNGLITGGNIINYSKRGLLRLDLVYGIGYGDDLLQAKQILQEIVTTHEKVAKTPAPLVVVKELGDNSVNFAVRPYVNPDDYWKIAFDITEKVKLRFDEAGISIPFPQRDVHLYQEK